MDLDTITKKILAGDIRSASRAIRNIEDENDSVKQVIKSIFPETGKAHIIGITGSPGAGKSTIINELITDLRKRKDSDIGVLAVDPTSPFSGGAILGDRIRMQRHAEDSKVFVRSLATRGALGGLSSAVGDAVHILDAMGKNKIIIETVGTGQQEVEIMNYAHTVLVILVPGMGDDIQMIKAGIIEIADIFIVNKADRNDSFKLVKDIERMLDMVDLASGDWRPPVMMLENTSDLKKFSKGIEKIVEIVESHHRYLIDRDDAGERMVRKAEHEMKIALKEAIFDPVMKELLEKGTFSKMVEMLLKKESDPYTLAEEIKKRYGLHN